MQYPFTPTFETVESRGRNASMEYILVEKTVFMRFASQKNRSSGIIQGGVEIL